MNKPPQKKKAWRIFQSNNTNHDYDDDDDDNNNKKSFVPNGHLNWSTSLYNFDEYSPVVKKKKIEKIKPKEYRQCGC